MLVDSEPRFSLSDLQQWGLAGGGGGYKKGIEGKGWRLGTGREEVYDKEAGKERGCNGIRWNCRIDQKMDMLGFVIWFPVYGFGPFVFSFFPFSPPFPPASLSSLLSPHPSFPRASKIPTSYHVMCTYVLYCVVL